MASTDARTRLAALLALAYSGERAAALAYRGHARSLREPTERAQVAAIEADEWRHRAEVGGMLATLGARPSRLRELRALAIGRALGLACHVAGRLAPLWGAGRLESRNVREYETAARLAHACGRAEWVEPLLAMAEVEHDHERCFRDKVRAHRLGRRLRLWPAPPPRAEIRASFERETGRAVGAPAVAARDGSERRESFAGAAQAGRFGGSWAAAPDRR